MKWLRIVPSYKVVLNRKVVEGLYKNLEAKEEEIDRLRDIITINHEVNKKHSKQIDELAKRINDIKEEYSGIFDENLSLAAKVASLQAENEILKDKLSKNKILKFEKAKDGE